MGKKRITTIGAEPDEEEKRKKEQKKKQKKLEKERAKAEKEIKPSFTSDSTKAMTEKKAMEDKKEVKKVEKKETKSKEETEKPTVEKKPASTKVSAGREEKTGTILDKKNVMSKEAKVVKKEAEKESVSAKKEEPAKEKPKVGKKVKPRVIRRGKNYKKLAELIEKDKIYSLDEGIELVKKTSPVKFDASVEIHIRLGVDLEKSEQNVRGTITLPYGSGKVKRVLVFTENKDKEAKAAGADQIGGDELINKVEKGFSDFDIVLATPDIMPKIAKLGKTLGQRGLMPNPKAGTITDNIEKLIKEIKQGRTEFKMDPQGIIHQVVGKISFDNDKLKENVKTLMQAVLEEKPGGLKDNFIKSITLCSTMGPGIKIKY